MRKPQPALPCFFSQSLPGAALESPGAQPAAATLRTHACTAATPPLPLPARSSLPMPPSPACSPSKPMRKPQPAFPFLPGVAFASPGAQPAAATLRTPACTVAMPATPSSRAASTIAQQHVPRRHQCRHLPPARPASPSASHSRLPGSSPSPPNLSPVWLSHPRVRSLRLPPCAHLHHPTPRVGSPPGALRTPPRPFSCHLPPLFPRMLPLTCTPPEPACEHQPPLLG